MARDNNHFPYALLLLPTPPSPALRQLKEAYTPALSLVLSKLSEEINNSRRTAVLDIALVVSNILAPRCQPRTRVWTSLQRLLANFYTLIGAVTATQDIELDGPGGVDARVFFADDDGSAQGSASLQGPLINLRTLGSSNRPWDNIYVLETPEGQQLASAFSTFTMTKPYITVPGGDQSTPKGRIVTSDEEKSASHYSVIVGGTFDHLHLGHKLLLTATALTLDPASDETSSIMERLLYVGITGDEMLVNKKYAEYLESWEERWRNVAAFLRAVIDFNPPGNTRLDVQRIEQPGPNGKRVLLNVEPDLSLRLVQIADPFGPTITEENLSALIVSAETRSGGQSVNDERTKKGWAPLEVLEVDVLQMGEAEGIADTPTQNFESKMSSTEIRRRRMKLAKGSL
jgi:phosphopantetheine adenylyltransferase